MPPSSVSILVWQDRCMETLDNLLFSKRALSNPGSLSHKNVSDIENNIIDGKTT